MRIICHKINEMGRTFIHLILSSSMFFLYFLRSKEHFSNFLLSITYIFALKIYYRVYCFVYVLFYSRFSAQKIFINVYLYIYTAIISTTNMYVSHLTCTKFIQYRTRGGKCYLSFNWNNILCFVSSIWIACLKSRK